MDIDRAAPVIARVLTQIAADRRTVWDVLTDFESWPAWKAEVRSLSLRGPVAPGSRFEWKAGPGTIKSVFEEVDQPDRIAWSGRTLGIRAVDVYRLEERDGGTQVTQEESWDGLPARLFRSRMRRTLQSNLERGLASLRAEAERRTQARGAA
jgi:uncharacterized protein YndB with AHSA1/START domain